jgi:acyl-coenzyme A thioesterase PaaI-like protein
VGRVLRRGRSLVNCEVEVVDTSNTLIAKAIATYKVG